MSMSGPQVVCGQCNGAKAQVGQEAVQDLSTNTMFFESGAGSPATGKQAAVVCTQCGGKGYY